MARLIELVDDLSAILGDYRLHEDGAIVTPERVEKWVNQFGAYGLDREDKKKILSEMSLIMKSRYLRRSKVKRILKTMIFEEKILGPIKDLRSVNFLRLQSVGRSQADLLLIVDEILQEEKGFTTSDCGGGNTYFYLDDCLYTGNRFKYELSDWIRSKSSAGNLLVTCHLAIHKQGELYAMGEVNNLALAKDVDFKAFTRCHFDNSRCAGCLPATLWPREIDDSRVVRYADKISAEIMRQRGFGPVLFRRASGVQDKLFSSTENRDLVEGAFLRAGTDLILAADKPAPSMRPLGFEVLTSLGFGAMFATYRNIANNCPLVLWYGDPENYPKSHTLSRWLPLLPRKI